MRACPGKLQRHGVSGELRCHKIDLDALNHMDVMTLRKYLSADAEILSRRKTGLCAKCQRQVSFRTRIIIKISFLNWMMLVIGCENYQAGAPYEYSATHW